MLTVSVGDSLTLAAAEGDCVGVTDRPPVGESEALGEGVALADGEVLALAATLEEGVTDKPDVGEALTLTLAAVLPLTEVQCEGQCTTTTKKWRRENAP